MIAKTHLAELESAGLVSLIQAAPEIEYIFRHTLIHDAAYGSLLKSDRQALHLATGIVLEELYDQRTEEIATVLARHFEAAGDDERALKYYSLSGERALAVYALPEAIAHYDHAIKIALKAPADLRKLKRLFSQRGLALELDAQYQRALENYHEMEALGEKLDSPQLILTSYIARAKVHATPSEVHSIENVQEYSRQALELAIQIDDQTAQARIYWILCLLYVRTGKYNDSILNGEKALELARQLDNSELQAYTMNDLSLAYLSTFQFEKGSRSLIEAQRLWRTLGNMPMLVDNLSTMTAYDYYQVNYEQALKNYPEAAAISQSIGNLWGQAYSRMFIGNIYYEMGRISEAIRMMEACLDLAKQAGFVIPSQVTQAELAWVYAYLGDSQRGLDILDSALKEDVLRIAGWFLWKHIVKARIHILRKEFDQAEQWIAQIWHFIKNGDAPGFIRLYPTFLECQLGLARQDYAEALDTISSLENESFGSFRHFLPSLLLMRGQALVGMGMLSDAQAALEKARQEAEANQRQTIAWEILAALAQLAERQGLPDQAAQYLAQARQAIAFIADHIEDPLLRASFLDRAEVSAIWQG